MTPEQELNSLGFSVFPHPHPSIPIIAPPDDRKQNFYLNLKPLTTESKTLSSIWNILRERSSKVR